MYMAKLADVDNEIRVIGKFAAIGVVALIVLFLVIMSGQFIKTTFFPTPLPPPVEKFGTLPAPDFPQTNSQGLTYNVNTLTGSLPALGDRINVYKTKTTPASLTALSNIRLALNSIGYNASETKIDENTYQWTNPGNNTMIQYNIATNDFNINSDLTTSPPASISPFVTAKDSVNQTVTDFLQSIGENTNNIDPTKTTITYLKTENGQLVGAASQSDAQYARIDLFQKDLNKTPIYFSGLGESPMYFILKGEENNPQIVSASYANSIPDTNAHSDYPIVSAQNAFEKLQKGNAVVFNNSNKDNIDITDVALGYYIAPNQPYFIPIVVFSGSGFKAYVDALPSQ